MLWGVNDLAEHVIKTCKDPKYISVYVDYGPDMLDEVCSPEDLAELVETLVKQRDEARKVASELRQIWFINGDFAGEDEITADDVFPWESNEIIGRVGSDLSFENTVMKE